MSTGAGRTSNETGGRATGRPAIAMPALPRSSNVNDIAPQRQDARV